VAWAEVNFKGSDEDWYMGSSLPSVEPLSPQCETTKY
jgi:hypothetical protein